jgi:hypothetical protein
VARVPANFGQASSAEHGITSLLVFCGMFPTNSPSGLLEVRQKHRFIGGYVLHIMSE